MEPHSSLDTFYEQRQSRLDVLPSYGRILHSSRVPHDVLGILGRGEFEGGYNRGQDNLYINEQSI